MIALPSPVVQSSLFFCFFLVGGGGLSENQSPRESLTGRQSPPTSSWWMHPIMDGGGVRSLANKEHLIRRSCCSPHQLSRAGDCFPCLEEIPELAVWNTCSSSDGQHHGDAPSKHDVGTRPRSLDGLVRELIQWCQTWSISLMTGHILDCDNIKVNRLSRIVSRPRDSQSPLQFMGRI